MACRLPGADNLEQFWRLLRAGQTAWGPLPEDRFATAGEFAEAARWYLRAGLRAAAQYANADAVDYFGRALEFTPPNQMEQSCAILLERARVFDLLGEREHELSDIQQLEEIADRLGDPLYQAETALRQASIAEITGGYMASAQQAQRAIRLGEEAGITRCVAEGYLRWGIVLMRQNEPTSARTQLEQALHLARLANLTRLEGESLRNLGIVNRMLGQVKQAREYHEQALQMSRRTGDRRGESSALVSLGVVASELSDYSEAIHYFELALRLSGALSRFWLIRSYFREGLTCLDPALELAHNAPDLISAKAYNGAGAIASAGSAPCATACSISFSWIVMCRRCASTGAAAASRNTCQRRTTKIRAVRGGATISSIGFLPGLS